MANPGHLAKLKEGVEAWNQWRKQNPSADLSEDNLGRANLLTAYLHRLSLSDADLIGEMYLRAPNLNGANLYEADLSGADLRAADLVKANLGCANLRGVNFRGADLSWASLMGADLTKADLSGACLEEVNLGSAGLSRAHLIGANLTKADLSGADLSGANLRDAHLDSAIFVDADLTKADLSRADLSGATLVRTNLEGANLTACSVYGISTWDVSLTGAIQSNLVITPRDESVIQVDNLEVAQFIYLLLNNEKIRDVIDTITSKVVLILGRFTPKRKVVLNAIREELRRRNYLPVLFDFKKPDSRNFTETVSTLAHMARFVIADLTDPRSIPQELMKIIPALPSVPVQPLLLASQKEYGMFRDFRDYSWVLEPFLYKDQRTLLAKLGEKVIAPAENKAKERTNK